MMNKNQETTAKPNNKKSRSLPLIAGALAVTVMIFLCLILAFAYGSSKTYSENENRTLAPKPVFSFSSVADGRFMKEAEEYLSDRFVFRDTLVRLRTCANLFFGKREINGVYAGKEHFLFEKPEEIDEDRLESTLKVINKITKNNPKVSSYFALAPNACEILPDLLPACAPRVNQTQQVSQITAKLKKIKAIDLVSPLKQAEDPKALYYRTDHHWTTEAAVTAFYAIAEKMKIKTDKLTVKTVAVTDSFRGTVASTSGIFAFSDTVEIPVPSTEKTYVVNYVEEKEKKPSVFDPSKLEEKDKYQVFFGGNFSRLIIDTERAKGRVLLLIKDSYANCLAPMLIPCFKTIVMVDPRYYTGDIQKLITGQGITDILWLYNVNTFLTDTSIAGLTH